MRQSAVECNALQPGEPTWQSVTLYSRDLGGLVGWQRDDLGVEYGWRGDGRNLGAFIFGDSLSKAERIMLEGIVGRVAPLSGYAWIKQHEKKLRLQEVERQQHMNELVEKAAPEFVKELMYASALKVLEHQGAASWREAALKRLQLIYASEQTGFLPPGISCQFVVKAGEVLSSADVNEDTKMKALTLMNELTIEVSRRN